MDLLGMIWGWLTFFSVLIFPQLLGVLLYLRLSRLPRWLARVIAMLAPAVVFFFLSRQFFLAGLREAQLRGEVSGCGMPALAAGFIILLGTLLQLCIAPGVHLWFLRKPRH
ncbi:MAG TPA: hypothetical protein VFS90_18940 [Pyrinomonadaceae bacterium]|nr:hypothetical protein [Pyrinomonadaceae bacterium]